MTKRPSVFLDEAYNDDFLELPHEDSAAYCRLCFSISQLEPLFPIRQDDNFQVIAIIEMCTGIKLSAKTDCPSSICLQCRLMMDEFFNFRKLCQRLNRVYRRKRNEMATAAKVNNTAQEYYGGGGEAAMVAVEPAVVPEALAVPEVILPGVQGIAADPTGMEITDETCATLVAPEPSALEASAVADGTAPESFIVHELSDEDDTEVQCSGAAAMVTIPVAFDGTEDNDDPFIKMANDWYCCKVCSRLYQSFVLLVEHLCDAHPEKTEALRTKEKENYFRAKDGDLQSVQFGTTTLVKCDLCDTLLCSRFNVMRHRWRYHGAFGDCRKYSCRVAGCVAFCMEKKALNRHLEVIHGRVRKPGVRRKPAQSTAEGAIEVADDDEEDDDVVFITDEVSQPASASDTDVMAVE